MLFDLCTCTGTHSVMVSAILMSKHVTACTCQYLQAVFLVSVPFSINSNLLDHAHKKKKWEGQVTMDIVVEA